MWGDIIKVVTKSYLYSNVIKDAVKFARENFSDLELDRDYWLHKAGLQIYSPTKSIFGGLGLMAFGLFCGGLIGLALAPKPGAELVSDVKDRAMHLFGRPEIQGQVPASA